MSVATCSLCSQQYPLAMPLPLPVGARLATAGWYPDGWVTLTQEGEAKLQPYCPVCKVVAQACADAVSTGLGVPGLVFQPEPGGRVRVVRHVLEGDTGPSVSGWRRVGDVLVKPWVLDWVLLIPAGPGREEAAWSLLLENQS